MWVKLLLTLLFALWVSFNALTAHMCPAKRMKQDFIDGQCLVGKIFANIFYLPAWILKAVKILIIAMVA